MAPSPSFLLVLLLTSLLVPSHSQPFTSILISQTGIDFLGDLLVTKAISILTPLQLPPIDHSFKIPFLGIVDMVLSDFTIYEFHVSSSHAQLGDPGIAIIASGTSCNLTMNWYYSYTNWLLPLKVSDKGRASVRVEGMEVGLTLGLENREGTLKLSLMDSGCYVKEICIKLDGDSAWLYQGMVDAVKDQIGSAVENAISKKLNIGILKADSFLQALPKEIPVDDSTSLNVTFMDDPILSNSSIEFKINGLFSETMKVPIHKYSDNNSQPSVFCTGPSKMIGISLDEAVFISASALYYDAKVMQWVVDKLPEQSLLNTAGWRFVVPQLYRKYPNDDMNMNISLSSPPGIRISPHNIDATVYADVIINVLEAGEAIPVVCISLVIRVSGSLKISKNNLAGSIKLDDFTMSLKWSKVGNLRMYLIKPIMWTVIETVFLPYANSHLGEGFPLPIIHGFTLQNAEIILSNSKIMVCSDVTYSESENLNSALLSTYI